MPSAKIIPISTSKRNQTTVSITVTRKDIKAGLAHPCLSPVSCALVRELSIDGAEVKHKTIKLFRDGKKPVVLDTPEIVQQFEYLFDMFGKSAPFRFAVNVPAQLVMQEVA